MVHSARAADDHEFLYWNSRFLILVVASFGRVLNLLPSSKYKFKAERSAFTLPVCFVSCLLNNILAISKYILMRKRKTLAVKTQTPLIVFIFGM